VTKNSQTRLSLQKAASPNILSGVERISKSGRISASPEEEMPLFSRKNAKKVDTRSLARLSYDEAVDRDHGQRQISYSAGYASGVQASLNYLKSLQRKDIPLKFAIANFQDWAQHCKNWRDSTRKIKRLDPPPAPSSHLPI